MTRRDWVTSIAGAAFGLAASVVSGIVVGRYMLSENQSAKASSELRHTVAQTARLVDRIQLKLDSMTDVISHDDLDQSLTLYKYRIRQLEKARASNAGRIQALIETQHRLCQIEDIVCATRNALWMRPDGAGAAWDPLMAHYRLRAPIVPYRRLVWPLAQNRANRARS